MGSDLLAGPVSAATPIGARRHPRRHRRGLARAHAAQDPLDAIADFEDFLALLEEHRVRYLIVGGLAFIYHAKPRYTKDIGVWVDPDPDNIERANCALEAFPSPDLLSPGRLEEILQIGVAPTRIDVLQRLGDQRFEEVWSRRIRDDYGDVTANWIDLDTLLEVKAAIDHPRHQEDARVLREVKRLRDGHS